MTTSSTMMFVLLPLLLLLPPSSTGQSDYLTCPREGVNHHRNGRYLKQVKNIMDKIPCDFEKQGWCGLPGDEYPWPTIRRFVTENRGLMRRMYGEVRQLNLMRLEVDNFLDPEQELGRSMEEDVTTEKYFVEEDVTETSSSAVFFDERNGLDEDLKVDEEPVVSTDNKKQDVLADNKKQDDNLQRDNLLQSIQDQNSPEQQQKKTLTNACPVKEEVVAPYWANNTRGEILALLNLHPFEQYVHWEKCNHEHRQMFCRSGCSCIQQYRLHRLLAFDPTNECRGIFSDWFRFPSCCVCKCLLSEQEIREVNDFSERKFFYFN